MCIALSFIGTMQASWTDFRYVGPESKEIFDREALLGCGICGWMNSPKILLDPDIQKMGAELILQINEEVASIIGINKAARATCSKPDGNTGVLLQAASGCHGEEAPYYFRLMQINKEAEISKYLKDRFPFLVEESVWSKNNTDYVLYLPIEAKQGSIFKSDLYGVKQLDVVKTIQSNWVEYGTREECCVRPFLRHNVSNTVQVPDNEWGDVSDFLFENKQYFSGVSFLGVYGSKDFKQAPFTPVSMPSDILQEYGDGAILASGLIVDGLHDFDDDLWDACNAVLDSGYVLDGTRRQVLLKKEWLRRAKSFAKKFFKNDLKRMVYCLKDVYLYHKWAGIKREFKGCNILAVPMRPEYTDADTLGSAGCVGGACELPAEYLERLQNK
jgi:ribonucleoside-diphosphate reductase alpha chain